MSTQPRRASSVQYSKRSLSFAKREPISKEAYLDDLIYLLGTDVYNKLLRSPPAS